MKQMAKDLGLKVGDKCADSQVIFVGAVHDRDLMRHYYEAADLFLFPSLYDNAPLVVREAAALHTPSVLLRGATAAEIVADGYNGFLSEANENAYATLIERVLTEPATLEYVGGGAAKTLARSWENIAEEVSDRYTRLIKRFNNLHA